MFNLLLVTSHKYKENLGEITLCFTSLILVLYAIQKHLQYNSNKQIHMSIYLWLDIYENQ